MLCLAFIVGCTPSPRPLNVGGDQCKHCLMTVSDERYGAEIVLTTGKVLTFDSVECLASYLLDNSVEMHSLWVVDYAQPDSLLPVKEAAFLHSDALRSPMGMNLAAFNKEAAASWPVAGRWMDWEEVLDFVNLKGAHEHSASESLDGGSHF